MQNWFECKASYVKIDDDGRERKVSENYLLDAVSYTDAETRFIKQLESRVRGEFNVKKISASNIIEIFPYETGEWWYKAKIGIVTIDEEKGKEKKVNHYFLVAADDIKEALKRLEEGLAYILVPYQTTSITLSSIVDVFPYFEDKVNAPIPPNLKPLSNGLDQNGKPLAIDTVIEEEEEESDD